MPGTPSVLFDRPDTFLGVCEGIGREFGFHPNILRIVLAVGLLWQPWIMVGCYAVLAVGVALSRWLFPVAPRPEAVTDVAAEPEPIAFAEAA